MGNWRTVNITGTIAGKDLPALYDVLDLRGDYYRRWPPDPVACLAFDSVSPSICGLGMWPDGTVNAQGNLFERNYSCQDVADALTELVKIAPSMLLVVHCGGERESDECVATIRTGEGLVMLGKPEVKTITGPSEEQILAHLHANLYRADGKMRL